MYKLLIALLALQILALTAGKDALADPTAQVIVSPDGALRAIIIPVDRNAGFIGSESRVEIRKSDRELLSAASYASSDGEHGLGVMKGQWTPDSQFFVYNTSSSGGHQPYHSPTFFYSRRSNRIRNIEELTHSMVLDQSPFEIVAPHSVTVVCIAKYDGSLDGVMILANLETGAVSTLSKTKYPAR